MSGFCAVGRVVGSRFGGVVLALVLIGCQAESDHLSVSSIETQELESGSSINALDAFGSGRLVQVYSNVNDFQQAWNSVSESSAPDVDFDNASVVLLYEGVRVTGGCDESFATHLVKTLAEPEAAQDENETLFLKLDYKLTCLDPGTACDSVVITDWPYRFIQVDTKAENIALDENYLYSNCD